MDITSWVLSSPVSLFHSVELYTCGLAPTWLEQNLKLEVVGVCLSWDTRGSPLWGGVLLIYNVSQHVCWSTSNCIIKLEERKGLVDIVSHLTPEMLNPVTVFFLSRQDLTVSPWKLQLRLEIQVECS